MQDQERVSQSPEEPLLVVGWREQISLPELGILDVKAKIDTGARSSALHALEIKTFEQDGRMMVRFKVHPYQHDPHRTLIAVAALLDQRQVRNSGGQSQVRPVIQTTVELGGKAFPIELTLTNRDVMGFRMLLGRQAVRGRFLVDAARSFLQSRRGTNANKS